MQTDLVYNLKMFTCILRQQVMEIPKKTSVKCYMIIALLEKKLLPFFNTSN